MKTAYQKPILASVILVNGLLCMVSFWTSKLGLDTATDIPWVSVSVAFAGGAFAFVFWNFLTCNFPEVFFKRKVQYGIIVLCVLTLLFGFSTQWSVITLGGKEAIGIHMQQVISKSDKQSLELMKRGYEEANLAPHMLTLASQFDSYANREAKGAFSGLAGEGEVVSTLRNTAETFRALATSIQTTEKTRKDLHERLKTAISKARNILTSTDSDMREMNLEFSKNLAVINELLTRMSETSSKKFIHAVNNNLQSLTVLKTDKMKEKQKEAIERLKGITSGAQSVLTRIAEEAGKEDVEIETFTMISMSKAVMIYAGEIFYAWAYAIALDLAPFFFVILFAINASQIREEEKKEEDEKLKIAELNKGLNSGKEESGEISEANV